MFQPLRLASSAAPNPEIQSSPNRSAFDLLWRVCISIFLFICHFAIAQNANAYILTFSPASGPVGSQVTLKGSFNAQSTVTFSGTCGGCRVPATRQYVGTGKLIATVPAGAQTGYIEVTTGGVPVDSATAFTVASAPTISGFSPSSGVVGDVITISGSGFGATPSANSVTFNGVPAIVGSSSTITTLYVTVPARTTSSPITVTVNGLSATSSSSFNVSCPSIESVTTLFNGFAYAGLGIDGSGNIYLADQNAIYKSTPEGNLSLIAGDVATSGTSDGTGSAARFNYPQGLVIDSAGNVYIADRGNSTIRKITPAGVVTTFAGSPGLTGGQDGAGTAARFNAPYFLALDSAANIYVTDAGNYTVRKISPAGTVTTLAGAAGISGTVDGTGSAARFSALRGITLDMNNNVYVVDGNAIRKIDQSGAVSTFVGNVGTQGDVNGVGTATRFSQPTQITTDSFGHIYVADTLNGTIRGISPDGSVWDFAGGSANTQIFPDLGYGNSAVFASPFGVTVDSQGVVYVSEPTQGNLRKITAVPNCPAPTCTSMGPKNTTVVGSAATTRFYAYGVQNATIVYFPTWWVDGGNQNDIQWLQGTNDGGGTWHVDVPLSQYDTGNPRYGNFATQVYMANPDYQSGATQWCDGTQWVRNTSTSWARSS